MISTNFPPNKSVEAALTCVMFTTVVSASKTTGGVSTLILWNGHVDGPVCTNGRVHERTCARVRPSSCESDRLTAQRQQLPHIARHVRDLKGEIAAFQSQFPFHHCSISADSWGNRGSFSTFFAQNSMAKGSTTTLLKPTPHRLSPSIADPESRLQLDCCCCVSALEFCDSRCLRMTMSCSVEYGWKWTRCGAQPRCSKNGNVRSVRSIEFAIPAEKETSMVDKHPKAAASQ